ncbi:hypothetical protein [Planctobacterium marinum]|uniref:hypothetical protein n=1 Tax=Planctobacterium marinum TaxID=1631968 RepID=UPI001E405E4B|nr:hypothetical protein [Planctobacterium marinum]MCC2606455.1 hypothetical protein [Planctobacterium marinum]
MSDNNKSNNRKTLIIFVLVFLVPVVLAWFALQGDWFNKGATNKGELLNPAIEMPELLRGEKPFWRLVYVLPANCDARCKNAIYSLNQVWIAAGKEQDRIVPTVLIMPDSDTNAVESLSAESHFVLLNTQSDYLDKVFKKQTVSGIFIADTLGNVILRYPLSSEQQQAVLNSRDILADLRKLLKLSRIG